MNKSTAMGIVVSSALVSYPPVRLLDVSVENYENPASEGSGVLRWGKISGYGAEALLFAGGEPGFLPSECKRGLHR